LAVALPGAPARAQLGGPNIKAWVLRADFTGAAPSVLVTEYNLQGDSAIVAGSATRDISPNCVQVGPGTIRLQGGKAVFDGTTYLRCTMPPNLLQGSDCQVGGAAFFFFSAEGVFDPAARENPLLVASNGSFAFSAPSSGAQLRTHVQLLAQGYETSPWHRDGSGNEVIIGQDGPTIITASTTLGLLGNLDPSWQDLFKLGDKTKVNHQMYSAAGAQRWSANAAIVPFPAVPSEVFIGYNPASGAIFRGQLSHLEGDPPGCVAK